MGVDVHMSWRGQTTAEENTVGYVRGAGASLVLFAECWNDEAIRYAEKLLGKKIERRAEKRDPDAKEDKRGTAFPGAVLRRRERTARRYLWLSAEKTLEANGVHDREKVHHEFLTQWLPYKDLIATAERKELETGEPVRVGVYY